MTFVKCVRNDEDRNGQYGDGVIGFIGNAITFLQSSART